jgi:cyanophycinase
MERITLFLFLIVLSFASKSQTLPNELSYGYPNGTMIIIGGGFEDELIMEEFKKYAGGDTANIVIIPTALDDKFFQQDSAFIEIRKFFKRYGMDNFTILHTRDSSQANSDEFIKPLKTATGIFFTGGRQWRIADSYLNTKVQDEMFKLLDRGGVIAGSSAGASIQGSYLARGDSKNDQLIIGDHEIGFGFITNVAIDQHVLARNRQFDMFDILKKHPELLGIGIDENTAIIVKGNTFEVIGTSSVLIYDKTFWSSQGAEFKNLPGSDRLFYFLKCGDKYNLTERKVIEQ